MRFVTAVALGFVLIALGGTAASADPIDDYVTTQMATRKIPGAAVAVIRDGVVVKRAAYGRANIEHDVPVSTDTLFSLASTSKVFTAAAIMTLVQDGRLTLDQPVREILPELPQAWSPVTVRQCLSHTSGLPELDDDDLNVTPSVGDRQTFLRVLADRPVEPPGRRVAYNQTGYVLMGMVIERLSGRTYESYVQERLLGPAGVTRARYGDAWEIIPQRADLYTTVEITPDHAKLLARNGRPLIANRIRHYGSKYFPEFLWPTVGLNASLDDLVAFELALRSGKVMRADLLAEMMKPPRLADGREGDYGLGFIVGQTGGRRTVAYGGGAAVWRLSVGDAGLTVIVLTNLQGSSPQALAAEIARLASSVH